VSQRKKILLLGDVNSIHLQKWAIGLKDDFDITIISLDPLEVEVEEFKSIVIFSNKEKTANQSGKLTYLKSILRFRKFHKEIDPDFVHAHYSSSYGLIGALLKPKKFFISVWGEDVYEFPKRSWIHKIVYKWTIKKAHRLFSTSHDMKVELEKYTSKEITVIPFGIDLSLFEEKKVEHSSEQFVVGTVKALEHIYGIDKLISAFALFHKKVPKSKCVIYGKGTAEKELKNLSAELGVQNAVFFKGFIPNTEVPKAIYEIDVFCVLSRQESFGVAAVEASACGTPVIASNIGGLPEVVKDKETGYIVSSDIHQISERISELYHDEDLRKKMGQAGRKFVTSQYDWHNNVKTMKQFYNE